MARRRWVLVVAVVLVALLSPAHAAHSIAVGEVHAETDVGDEAAAITLLVHTALAGPDATLVAPPAELTLPSAPLQLTKANIEHAIVMELSRDGSGLRLTFAILAADGNRDIGFVRAGDGNVHALAQGVVDRAVIECKLTARRTVPAVPLGALRPYASALRQRSLAPLVDAVPVTALTVPAAAKLLAPLVRASSDPIATTIAARALRDGKTLAELGAGTDAAAVGARALAALARSSIHDAEQALGARPPRHGLVTIAQVALAEAGSDTQLLEARIKAGLVSDQVRPVLAIASTLVPTRISPALHRALLAATEKQRDMPGVAARIGLNAAEAGVDITRALALISARELERYDLQRLDALVQARTDAVGLRLRAELSMRRADGLENALVPEYARTAPTDARAYRYQGWVLAGEGKYAEAAAALAKANARRELARAQFASGDSQAALATIGTPVSAEDHVYVMHVALRDKRAQDAASALATAEKLAPISPIVHRAIVALDPIEPDPERVAISRTVLGKTADVTTPAVTQVDAVRADATDTTTALDAPSAGIRVTAAGIDPLLLEPLLARLDGLARLRDKTLVLAQVRWEPPWHSFQVAHGEPLKATLVRLLAAAPYQIKLRDEPALPPGTPSAATLTRMTGDAHAVLLYRVAPSDRGPEVTLSFYERDANELAHVTSVIRAPELVTFDAGKLKLVLAFAGVLLLGLGVYVTRAKGTVRIKVARAPDVGDEVLCVEVSKSPVRPRVEDAAKFALDTKKVGAVHKARHATLIASGHRFKVSTGHWYVHLYGAFTRGGKALVVPSSCTQEVVLERGQLADLEFNLASKLAEVRVEVVATPRRGLAVWTAAAEHAKTYTDDTGLAILELPVGSHTLCIEAKGKRFERPLQITAAKQHRVSFNVERELRLEESVQLDGVVVTAEAKLAAGTQGIPPSTPAPQLELRTHARGIAAAQTAPLPGSIDRAMPAIAIGDMQLAARAVEATAQTAYSAQLAQPHTLSAPRAQPRAATPRPGEMLLGRYRITAELGRGAMGVVHRAWDEKLERAVAIKEMADDLRTNPEAMRLFEQEAKALAQLNHTNIVAMYDQVTDASGVFMIMELVDGKPLADLARDRGPLPWLEAVGIVDQVCTGLAYAHARKVIHRDIKPANCFVASDRTVKLGDFGLARVMREVTIQRTEIRGTPLYMAPEQITGTNVDHRADLYAVGCMLFELLTGRPPFIDGDILYAQMHLPPPQASSLADNIPPALEELLASLLAKQADDRPGSANEVRTAFKQLFAA